MSDDTQQSVATITSQIDGVGEDETGKVANGTWVYFTTAKGVKGSVFVPRNGFSMEVAHAAVRARANMLDSLQGSTVY